MATDMVVGYIYFLESDATDNINWVPTVDNIILAALYTEGTEYVKMQIPKNFKIRGKTGIIVNDSGGGSSFDYRPNRRAYAMLSNGVETTIANAAQVANFFMLERHTSGAAATFKRYYCVIKHTAGYYPFINAAGTSVDYCKGVVLDWEVDWEMDDNERATVYLNWRSVW